MTITLTRGTTTIALPDLHWTDEFDWQPIEQAHSYSLSGALIVEAALRQAGRPITLAGDDGRGWCTRADCLQLRSWASVLDEAPLTLVLRGSSRAVVFDHAHAPAFTARAVVPWADASLEGADWYIPTLKLAEV